jgi:septal ring factor EnvC (AmiA/AmiB activator)
MEYLKTKLALLTSYLYNNGMAEITTDLIFQVLKSVQSRLDSMDKSLKDLAQGQIRVREDLNNFHRDTIRLESQIADINVRLERIEKRFEAVQVN